MGKYVIANILSFFFAIYVSVVLCLDVCYKAEQEDTNEKEILTANENERISNENLFSRL